MKLPTPLIFATVALLTLKIAAAADPAPSPTTSPVAGAQATPSPRKGLPPTMEDVPYGSDPSQKLDFWQAKSDKPTPLVFFIHGGGWINGDKNDPYSPKPFLDAGISVVSINYRLIPEAEAQGIKPPVEAPMHDAARALQFVRSKAKEWNIDKHCIGAGGSSAGSCTALWLAFHDDMADPKSSDPIARESTRLVCAGLFRAQTSLDPKQTKEWIPNMNYGGHAFGFRGQPFEVYLENREKIMPWIKEYSPIEWVSADDPPVYIAYNKPPAMGQPQEAQAHSANLGLGLQERMKQVGVDCQIMYPGVTDLPYQTPMDYLLAMLKACAEKHPAAK